MEVVNILVSRNHSEQDWSVEIDGLLYEHISTKTLDDLVEYAVVVAQQHLLESEASTDSGENESVLPLRLTVRGHPSPFSPGLTNVAVPCRSSTLCCSFHPRAPAVMILARRPRATPIGAISQSPLEIL
jgi:hypothetical protein